MPKPVKKSDKCTLEQLPDIEAGRSDVKTVSLFEQKRVRGFWPCFNDEKGERELTVSVEASAFSSFIVFKTRCQYACASRKSCCRRCRVFDKQFLRIVCTQVAKRANSKQHSLYYLTAPS